MVVSLRHHFFESRQILLEDINVVLPGVQTPTVMLLLLLLLLKVRHENTMLGIVVHPMKQGIRSQLHRHGRRRRLL